MKKIQMMSFALCNLHIIRVTNTRKFLGTELTFELSVGYNSISPEDFEEKTCAFSCSSDSVNKWPCLRHRLFIRCLYHVPRNIFMKSLFLLNLLPYFMVYCNGEKLSELTFQSYTEKKKML